MNRAFRLLMLLALSPLSLCLAQGDELSGESAVAVQSPAPVSNLTAKDNANDHGHAVRLTWELSPDDGSGLATVVLYSISRWEPFLIDTVRKVHQRISSARSLIIRTDEGDEKRNGRSDSDLKKEIKQAQIEVEDLESRIAESHAAYPENGEWRHSGNVPSGSAEYTDAGTRNPAENQYIPDYVDLYYQVEAVAADSTIRSVAIRTGPVQSFGQWYNGGRTVVLIAVLLFTFLTLLFVQMARRGADMYVRPLAGIEAVDEAIGRATEMGRPILYVLGLGSASDIATIASFTVLGRVSKKVAEYQTQLLVPCYDPIVMSVAQEVVRTSYLDAGYPDAYNDDMVYFITQSQFAYVAAVNGTMLRELPATNIYLGKFYAESLLLAETGALAGSIQIAGTDEIPQIPFFIVACDYTLIGEELFAASAYLGREPMLLGSLKAQDWAKGIIVVLVLLGVLAINIGTGSENLSWMTGFKDLFTVGH